jgi:hypothetical protein
MGPSLPILQARTPTLTHMRTPTISHDDLQIFIEQGQAVFKVDRERGGVNVKGRVCEPNRVVWQPRITPCWRRWGCHTRPCPWEGGGGIEREHRSIIGQSSLGRVGHSMQTAANPHARLCQTEAPTAQNCFHFFRTHKYLQELRHALACVKGWPRCANITQQELCTDLARVRGERAWVARGDMGSPAEQVRPSATNQQDLALSAPHTASPTVFAHTPSLPTPPTTQRTCGDGKLVQLQSRYSSRLGGRGRGLRVGAPLTTKHARVHRWDFSFCVC